MKDIETLNAIKTYLEQRKKMEIAWGRTPVSVLFVDREVGISSQIEFIAEEIRSKRTFSTWEVINRDTLEEILSQLKDTIELDADVIDKFEFPVFFYTY